MRYTDAPSSSNSAAAQLSRPVIPPQPVILAQPESRYCVLKPAQPNRQNQPPQIIFLAFAAKFACQPPKQRISLIQKEIELA
jgi:hypothetical protein